MRQLFQILTISLCLVTPTTVIGQTALEKYGKAREKTSTNYQTALVTDDEITVSSKNPLIIRSPSNTETFKVYAFTKIWEGKVYNVFVGLSDDPFKPNLVTTDKKQIQIDKIQLLGNHGQSRPGYEPVEEVKIANDKEIILTAKLYTWTLDSNGQKLKDSEKIETKIEKYRITDNGKIEKVKD